MKTIKSSVVKCIWKALDSNAESLGDLQRKGAQFTIDAGKSYSNKNI